MDDDTSARAAEFVQGVLVVLPRDLSDRELYLRCQEYGGAARRFAQKFAGLLPEVNRRGLYKRRGFASIHQFANIVGGMSDYAVDKILRISERLKDKPLLFSLFEKGEVGWSKIEKVAYIATIETDEDLAGKVQSLSTRALEVFVRDFREDLTHVSNSEYKQPLRQDPLAALPPPDDEVMRFSCPVTPEVGVNLRVIKQHLERQQRQSLTWNQVFQGVFERMEAVHRPLQFKCCPGCGTGRASVQVCEQCARKMLGGASVQPEAQVQPASRHIPAETLRLVQLKFGKKCGFPGCLRPSELFHHVRRFSLERRHDPDSIVPLCKAHHDLAHAGLIGNEQKNVARWFVRAKPAEGTPISMIDARVQQHKLKRKRPG